VSVAREIRREARAELETPEATLRSGALAVLAVRQAELAAQAEMVVAAGRAEQVAAVVAAEQVVAAGRAERSSSTSLPV
jgi:hypothetical protein